tara:strand:- start:3246 stop:3509 length:264 start_codon:yes stop_codon:yes gene_type:complete
MKSRNEWIEITRRMNGSIYYTAIKCSDITAVQYDAVNATASLINAEIAWNVNVDIHVSDTIFTAYVRDNSELQELLTKITGMTGDEE